MNKRRIGFTYEDEALNFLKNQAYNLLCKNYYSPYGEIDLVMIKANTLHFIEVKYRATNHFGSPRDSITPVKLKRLKLSAIHYLKTQSSGWNAFKIGFIGITNIDEDLQFDYIENIFD